MEQGGFRAIHSLSPEFSRTVWAAAVPSGKKFRGINRIFDPPIFSVPAVYPVELTPNGARTGKLKGGCRSMD